MRIALISPRGSFFGKNEEFYDFWESSVDSKAYRDRWSGVSSGLLIVAALTPPAYQIDFIDDNVDTIDLTAPYDLVGISGITQQAPRAYEIADEFRKKGITVVMGGTTIGLKDPLISRTPPFRDTICWTKTNTEYSGFRQHGDARMIASFVLHRKSTAQGIARRGSLR